MIDVALQPATLILGTRREVSRMLRGTGLGIVTQLCKAIEQLRGVEMAQVVMAGPTEVSEVHVVATPERKPKQIVRDIESLLRAQFGLNVDYRKISLAQIQGSPRRAVELRPRLITAGYVDQARRRLQVVLLEGDQEYVGIAEGVDSVNDDLSLTALATLNAMHSVVGQSRVFHLVVA